MLILSRRPTETIRFPSLGISVSIVSVKGSRVQVGIDAPPAIQVIRSELESDRSPRIDQSAPKVGIAAPAKQPSTKESLDHALRNSLNKATLELHLAKKQLAAGQFESAEQSLANALAGLAKLNESASLSSTSAKETVQPFSPAKADSAVGTSASLKDRVKRRRTEVDVLLVEDDVNERELLTGLLEMEGYKVVSAQNGLEALERLENCTPRFVLLDMMMPGCNGRETFDRIRKNPRFDKLPIVAVSGASPESLGLSIGDQGVDDWFPKPVNAPRLVKHMRDQLSRMCT